VSQLSLGQKQLVEIAKALSAQARILIFDEPTSSLSLAETRRLLGLIKDLRDSGVGILYVTHRLGEIEELADRVIVLRDGEMAGLVPRSEISQRRIVSLMVGRDIQQFYQQRSHQPGATLALRVEGLRYAAARVPISFSVAKGEIVGFAGLIGAGRTELARALAGIDPVEAGSVQINGSNVQIRNPRQALRCGLFLVPEDRKSQGLFVEDSLVHNVTIAALPKLGQRSLRSRKAERALAERQIRNLSIRAPGLNYPVVKLSGGNQQKVVLAKWLALDPVVLILDEPTRGIDIAAKSDLYGFIFDLASRGVGILLISSEMEEIIAIADRVMVMHEGGISGELRGDQITEENVMALAVGGAA
jgi:ribose transport system ATP-binding protein